MLRLQAITLFQLLLFLCCTNSSFADCGVNASQLAFGIYDPFQANPTDSNGSIQINCDERTQFTVDLSQGNSNSFDERHLTNGNNILVYNIFTRNNRRVIWGDGNNNTGNRSFNRRRRTLNVPARIEASQRLIPTGQYSDSITVSVTF